MKFTNKFKEVVKIAFTTYLVGKRDRLSWIAETAWATGGTMTGGEIIGAGLYYNRSRLETRLSRESYCWS